MQEALIQRYLGNKSSISSNIIALIKQVTEPGSLVFDAFSGSLAVSTAIRSAGFEVACNDINHFSWLFAKAYFSNEGVPKANFKNSKNSKLAKLSWEELIFLLVDKYSADFPIKARRSDIFDHYCEQGLKSGFISSRGSVGRRRFFSAENATLIDRALSRIRYWHQEGFFDEQTRCILTASLISAVEKISNTQGTFHDFPRTLTDSRSLKRLVLRVPDEDIFSGLPSNHIGKSQDTLEFVKTLPKHSVMYLDPPYNFRQYTSYYFMLNLLSEHAEINDLDSYFSNVQFVRGQNMDSDFKSSFCSKKNFLPSLDRLIRNANCEYVIMSYFDGRNHWGKFDAEHADTIGRNALTEFFSGEMFVPNSLECLPVKRKNYQSYPGHQARIVNEYLFLVKKNNLCNKMEGISTSARGKKWIGTAVV